MDNPKEDVIIWMLEIVAEREAKASDNKKNAKSLEIYNRAQPDELREFRRWVLSRDQQASSPEINCLPRAV